MSRTVAGALLLALAVPAAGADGISCHIHPPGSSPARPVGTIGPFASATACERARLGRFGDAGRCHCVSDFAPRWVPPADFRPPGDAPSG